jgi:hypothetical protein
MRVDVKTEYYGNMYSMVKVMVMVMVKSRVFALS